MENYEKGEVHEVDVGVTHPFPQDSVQMKVNHGSKIKNLMGFAVKKLKEPNIRTICWSGSGQAVVKTVSCAEILKRKDKTLYQITEVYTRRVEEYWEPKIEGLERLRVSKDIPAINIILSKDSLDSQYPGYQAPGSVGNFAQKPGSSSTSANESKTKGNSQKHAISQKHANSKAMEGMVPMEKKNKKKDSKKFDRNTPQQKRHKSDKTAPKTPTSDNQAQSKSQPVGATPSTVKDDGKIE